MTDDTPAPTVETPDAPMTTPLRRRLWYLAAAITLAATIAAYATLARPTPLTPTEEGLVGTWTLFEDAKVVSRLTFCSDRTCRQEDNPGPRAQYWPFQWKIENGRCFARQGFRDWNDVVDAIVNLTIFSPEVEVVSIRFISNDEVELGSALYVRQNAVIADQ